MEEVPSVLAEVTRFAGGCHIWEMVHARLGAAEAGGGEKTLRHVLGSTVAVFHVVLAQVQPHVLWESVYLESREMGDTEDRGGEKGQGINGKVERECIRGVDRKWADSKDARDDQGEDDSEFVDAKETQDE